MNINKRLLYAVDSIGFEYSLYGCELKPFLAGELGFLERRQTAENITEDILREHGKQELVGCLAQLAKIETGIRELEPYTRDHVLHALLTFILGIYINENYINSDVNGEKCVSGFQWKLSGLLHDVGYPIEISMRVMRPFADTINRLRRDFGKMRPVDFRILPQYLNVLSNRIDGLDLIQSQLTKWDLYIDAHKEYASMIRNGLVCHGMISSLAVLNVIDAMYQKNNPGRLHEATISEQNHLDWNQDFFESDIVPACSAIFIHNLGPNGFRQSKINLQKAPLPFLLVLADTLQEWERPSYNNPAGFSSDLFDIQISNGNLYFYADIPEKRKDGLRESIVNTLDFNNIYIK